MGSTQPHTQWNKYPAKRPLPSPQALKYAAKTRDTMACNFMTMFKAGPEVSLKGSPTVSPCTAASWASRALPAAAFSSSVFGFFVYRNSGSSEKPFLMYFLQLSQAPPEFDMEMANCTAETKEPVNKPNTAWTPNKVPAMSVAPMTKAPGATISFKDDFVEIAMHLS